jgi:hypothetical protein
LTNPPSRFIEDDRAILYVAAVVDGGHNNKAVSD